jgi:antitoxin MazE
MKTRLLRWGNDLALRIPRVFAENAGLNEGDAVELLSNEEGTIEIRQVSKAPALLELLARITPENRHEEIPMGSPTGKE